MEKEDIKWINKMALPALAGTVVETIFSIADQAIIGRTSMEGYAAVGVVANILYLLTGTIGILAVAFGIIFGKAIGSEDKERAEKIFNTTINITLVMLITSIITNLSVCEIASFNLLESITSVVLLPIYSYAGALLTLVTQAYAKKDMKKVRNYPIVALLCSIVAVIIIGGMAVGFPEFTSGLITNKSQVVAKASVMMPLAIGILVFNTVNQVYKYCLQGTSCEKWVFIYSLIISTISCGVIYMNVVVLEFGLKGVYLIIFGKRKY